jgi:hypothetical protein
VAKPWGKDLQCDVTLEPSISGPIDSRKGFPLALKLKEFYMDGERGPYRPRLFYQQQLGDLEHGVVRPVVIV